MRLIIYCLLYLFTSALLLAQGSSPINEGVFLQFDAQNKPFIQYQVKKGQTLFAIRAKYGLSESELLLNNPQLNSNHIYINQWINIPVGHLLNYSFKPSETVHYTPVYYLVQNKESLYSIAKLKTKWDLKTLKSQNLIIGDQVNLNQSLKIAYLVKLGPETEDAKPLETCKNEKVKPPETSEEVSITEAQISEKKNENIMPVYSKEIRGVAMCPNNKISTGKYFALCNYTKRGSQIEVYNPVLERSVLAKVVGRIPHNYSSDIQVIVSSEVANALGSLGKKFFVYLRY